MAEEFKIRTKVDIEDSEARKKLIGLKEYGEKESIKLNVKLEDLSKLANQTKQLNGLMSKAFKLDDSVMKNLKQLESTIKEINKLSQSNKNKLFGSMASDSSEISQVTNKLTSDVGKMSKMTQSELLSMYRNVSTTIDSLRKQLNKGLGESGIEHTTKEITRLESQLDKIKSNLSNSSKLELFDSSKTNKNLVEFNRNLANIEQTAVILESKIKGINFEKIDTSKIELLQNELKELKDKLSSNMRLDIDVGDTQVRLREINQEINNLKKTEDLAASFSKVETSMKDALGDKTVTNFRNELQLLEGSASTLDGSFDRAFNGLKSNIKDSSQELEKLNKRTSEFTRSISNEWNSFAGSIAAYSIGDMLADGIISSVRGFKDVFLELDGAMTNMKKVADNSDINSTLKLNNIKNEAIEVSKQVGMSTSDVINGIASSLQAGMGSMEESIKVARGAMILANTGVKML